MSSEAVTDFLRAHGFSLLFLVALVAAISWTLRDPWAETVLISTEPEQGELIENPRSWPYEGAVVTEVATFELHAVVLSQKAYRLDHFASVVPLDLALGWGIMSDPVVLRELKISQRNRWFWIRWTEGFRHSETEIFLASSNVHILPANDAVRRQLRYVDPGDNVHLSGLLVDVSLEGGQLRSSRSRADRGGGACEVFYVNYVGRQ
ncbi:MAG: hypothetical protein ACJAYU_002392 [Bradymonadia bacterium]|jgi:hypothetical protein